MSFKFFRKHQKSMLWVVVVITVLTFSIFSVTSTMQTCFRRKALPVGVFTSSTGQEVEITERSFGHAVNHLNERLRRVDRPAAHVQARLVWRLTDEIRRLHTRHDTPR